MGASNVCEVLSVDLAGTRARHLQSELNARAIRLVVYSYAALYNGLLRKILAQLPLLHELVLPDRERDPHLLACLSDLLERVGTRNPRLRDVVFSDGKVEAMW